METFYANSANNGMDDEEILAILRDHIPKIFESYHQQLILSLIKNIIDKDHGIKAALRQCDGLTKCITHLNCQ